MSLLERALRRDRALSALGLAAVGVAAWAYTLAGAGMGASALEYTRAALGLDAAIPEPMRWSPGHAAMMLAMWWVMMIAMMLPSAAPVVLLAAALNRRADPARPPYGAAGAFVAGYLLAWLAFSAAAVGAQWALEAAGLLSALMQASGKWLSAGLLATAGLWQFTPAKRACLAHCRSPVELLTRWRRPGAAGALATGARHGAYCLGCCWALMALLFVGGAMNLLWIAGLALYVLFEKLAARQVWIENTGGALLICSSVIVVLR